MRGVAAGLILFSAPVLAQDLKPFDFMGYVAGEQIPPEKLRKCGKGPDVTCNVSLARLSDVYVGYALTTHDYKISSLYVDASTNSYSSIREAFTVKYGPPCKTVEAVWKNAAGAQVENPTDYWCFKTGRMIVARYGGTIDKMAIYYADENAPEKHPSINF